MRISRRSYFDVGPKSWSQAVKRITGKSRESRLSNLSNEGDFQKLVCDINNYFYSVSADLPPLDLSLVPDIDNINDAFVIEPYQVERKLAKLNPE